MIVFFGIIVCYALLIGWLSYGFVKVPTFSPTYATPKTTISVVVPFRNEASALPRLLESIKDLDYPVQLFEVILVDDASTDTSMEIVKKYQKSIPNLCVIASTRSSASPKKDAIFSAIRETTGDWILTTDADCEVPKLWLKTLDSFIQEQYSDMITGPIDIGSLPQSPWLLQPFEILDTASLLGATIGGFGIGTPFMANGANLAYRKTTFLEVGGFQGNDHIASGDDIFLLQKFIAKDSLKVGYLKTETFTVQTEGQPSWNDFIQQRIRWASKTSKYTMLLPQLIGITVLLGNLSIAVAFVFLGIVVIGTPGILQNLVPLQILGIISLKIIVDFMLIAQGMSLQKGKKHWQWYPIIAILYPFVSSYIALRSLGGSYTWKGRRFKN